MRLFLKWSEMPKLLYSAKTLVTLVVSLEQPVISRKNLVETAALIRHLPNKVLLVLPMVWRLKARTQ